MDAKQLLTALKEIEPHVEGTIVQERYFEVRVQDPSDPAKTLPITSAEMKFRSDLDRMVIVLGTA